jgi:protein-disulfide isomerase
MPTVEKKKDGKSILSNNIFQIGLVVVLVVGAFFMGSLWTKVQMLEKGGATAAQPTTGATAQQQAAQPTVTLSQVKDAFNKSFIKFGNTNKKITFVEISDPSCPYCHIAGGKDKELNSQSGQFKMVEDGGTYVAPVPEMKKLVDSGKASFALIFYPGHGNGEMAQKALYCAFAQGKFWEVNDLIMNNAGYTLLNNTVKNDKTQSGVLADFLGSVVDSTTMKSCIDSGKYDTQLANDQKLAVALGVQGTPGFFINGTTFAGAYSFTDMQSAVDAALK